MAQDNTMFGGEGFKKAWDEQVGHFEAGVKELGKMQTQGVEQSQKAVDEWARITRESFAYGVAMQTQWRDASVEAMRKMSAFATASKLDFSRQSPVGRQRLPRDPRGYFRGTALAEAAM